MVATIAVAALPLVPTPEPQPGVLKLQCQLTAVASAEPFSVDA
jgi:hypothetical protein